ncbi:MAG: transporter substrate-binding domain-containing protein, partial [Gammaproteobacteria bacterium]|nr:transporter substrate-binding domain-containing protein [Gammaproteobacteria bacterium]
NRSYIQTTLVGAVITLVLLLTSCGQDESTDQRKLPTNGKQYIVDLADTYTELGDLDAMQQRGIIRFLMPRSDEADSYLPRQGFPLYQEMELASAFAEHLGLEPEWIFVERFDENIPLLLAGKGDLITANMTITEERKQKILFSVPIEIVREKIVIRAGDNVSKPSDLVGRRIAVQKSSSFYQTAKAMQKDTPGIRIDIVDENLTITEILEGVANSVFDVAIVDSNIAKEVLAYQDGLKVAFEASGDRAIAWGVRPNATQLKQQLDRFINREKLTKIKQPVYKADLPEIKKRKVLRVLTRNNAATYFLWRGELMGFEYELAREFAKREGLRLQMVVPPSRDQLIPWLREGKGDLVAASLTIEPELENGIRFSRRVNVVSEIVVTRADDDSINTLEDLAGRTFYVRPSSSYWRSLQKLKEMGSDFELKPAPENMETEEIIAKVADGEYDLTVSDSHILDIELTWRDDVKGTLALGDPVSHGWVVRAEDEKLLEAVNGYLRKEYRGLFYNVTHQKYFQEPHKIRQHIEDRVDRSEGGGSLSPFDDVVKRHADEYHFDWRLIVAQMYQESRFDPNAKSWAGARGLLQVMPRTAKELGIDDLKDPEQGIVAGVKYLAWLQERFEPELSVRDRMWFALAAYNAGAGHVRDARRLARRQGLESNRWFDNVEKAMLLLSKSKYAKHAAHGYVRGSEPVKYVRQIRDRYQAYLKLTDNGD